MKRIAERVCWLCREGRPTRYLDGYGWSHFTKYEQVPYEDEIAAVTARGGEASSTCRVALMARNAPDVRDGEV